MDRRFIPKELKVGYRKRRDTYSGLLAYVTYIDSKKVHRKKPSWEGWRDKDIDKDIDHSNVPTTGFVLNKKAGGDSWGWNPRQTYCRVWDPRGWEIEISIPNLLYILDHCTSTKGKGLEGEFVYGWDGADLLLVPTGASDYGIIKKRSDEMYMPDNTKYMKPKQFKVGHAYRNVKTGMDMVFMRTGPQWVRQRLDPTHPRKHWFADVNSPKNFTGYTATSRTFPVDTESEGIADTYKKSMTAMERSFTHNQQIGKTFKRATEQDIIDYMLKDKSGSSKKSTFWYENTYYQMKRRSGDTVENPKWYSEQYSPSSGKYIEVSLADTLKNVRMLLATVKFENGVYVTNLKEKWYDNDF